MRAKKGGYARQEQCRMLGIHPTAKATAVRLMKQMKRRNEASAPINSTSGRVNSPMERRAPAPIPPWQDPVQIRLQREADAAWIDRLLAHQEQLRRRRGR
jgi:hypothetical protein